MYIGVTLVCMNVVRLTRTDDLFFVPFTDVTAALEYSQTAQHKLAKLADLQIENNQLKDTLKGYNAELKDVKSQGKFRARPLGQAILPAG